MGALAKPALRGALSRNIKLHMSLAFAFATFNSILWHYGVCEPRKEAYRNFYATYDPDKEFERMRKAGVFMGIPAEGELEKQE